MTTLAYRFLVRGGTAANLTLVNEIPKARELVYEIDTGKAKLGNGVTAWNALSYLPGGVPGTIWRVGSGVPDNSVGLNGDLYLRTTNGDVYQRASGTYSVVMNLKGPPGDDGAGGSGGSGGTPMVGGLVPPQLFYFDNGSLWTT